MSVNLVNQTDASLAPIAGATLYADAPVGSIQAYGGATSPQGWLLCQGQSLLRTDYPELFAVIGTSFGSADSTHFNIPDLRDKFLEGASATNIAGSTMSAGLPDIQGSIRLSTGAVMDPNDTSGTYGTGAFEDPIVTSSDWRTVDAGISSLANAQVGQHFMASDSNAIYGNSNTVQPPAVCVNYIIKATTISLPSDFEDAVDEKFTADNSTLKDSTPTQNSVKPITSGGVYSSLADLTYQAIRNVALDSSATPFASLTTKDIQCGLLHIITFVAVLKVGQSFGDTKVATLPFNITASSYFAMSCWKSDAGLMGYIKTNGEIYMAGYNTSSSNAFELRGSCIVTTSTVYK